MRMNFILVRIIFQFSFTFLKQFDCKSKLVSISSQVLNWMAVIFILLQFFGNLIILLLTDSISSNQFNTFLGSSYLKFASTRGSSGSLILFWFSYTQLMVMDYVNIGYPIDYLFFLAQTAEENAKLSISSVKLLSSLSIWVSGDSFIILSISSRLFRQSSPATDVWDRSYIESMSQQSQFIYQLLLFYWLEALFIFDNNANRIQQK